MTIQALRAPFRMFVVCLLAASLMHAMPARADDYTDIWYNAAQSGYVKVRDGFDVAPRRDRS